MAAVEQFDLHLFIRRDVVGELHADLFPGWATVDEFVFQYPLHKGFADHWPGVINRMFVGQLQTMLGAGHRRDAVDHGVGEADMALDPVAQISIAQGGECQQGFTGHGTVVRQVIAGHQRERWCTGCAPFGQRRTKEPEHGFRCVRVSQIVLDLRQVRHELAVAVVDAIAASAAGGLQKDSYCFCVFLRRKNVR